MKTHCKIYFIERLLIFLFLFSFSMPYVRVGFQGLVWPKEYLRNPTHLPTIIEISLIFSFFIILVYKRITLNKLIRGLREDEVFRLISILFFYVCIFYPLIKKIIYPINEGAIPGVIRLVIAFPLIAYLVGYNINIDKKNILLIFSVIILVGTLQAIAMFQPEWFPVFMLNWTVEIPRPSGFWNLSTQAAIFLSIVFCCQLTVLLYIKTISVRIITLFLIFINLFAINKSLQRIPTVAISFLIIFVIFGIYKMPKSYFKKYFRLMIIVLMFPIIIVFVLYISPQIGMSIFDDYRYTIIWPNYCNYIFSKPLVLFFGDGLDTPFPDEYWAGVINKGHAHNQFLGFVKGMGLFMSIILFYLMFKTYIHAKICISSKFLVYYEKMIAFFCIAMLVVIMIISIVEVPLFQGPISIFIFFILGMVNSLYKTNMIKNDEFKK